VRASPADHLIGSSLDRRAEPRHQVHEFRETRGDHRRVVDGHGVLGGEAQDEEAHGDAVVEMGLHLAARSIAEALAAGAAAHDQRGFALVAIDAVELEAVGDGRKAVGLLDAQFVEAVHHGRTFGKGGRDREHRILVDHRRGALFRHGDALQLRIADAEVGDVLAAGEARVHDFDIGAHFLQRQDQAGAGRVHQHVENGDVGSRHEQRRDQREGGGGRIARDVDHLARQLAAAFEADGADACGIGFNAQIGAEALQHLFRVVAGHHRLDDGGDAGRVEAGEQHGGFHLGGCHRHAIGDRVRRLRPAQRHRQPVAFGRLHLDAHLAQWIEHAAHRPLGQRGIADEGGIEIVDADQTHGQPAAGAGIAEIERCFGRQQRAVADAVDDPGVALLADLGAHRLHRLAGVDDVLPLEKTGDARLAGGKAAEHEGAVRDRLVAGNADRALEIGGLLCGGGPRAQAMGHDVYL